MNVLVVSDHSSQADIAVAIKILKILKGRYDRMPRHWVDRRQDVMDEIHHWERGAELE